MPSFFKKYTRTLIVLLAILVNIPCSFKKELKQALNIETESNQHSDSGKIACASYCSVADIQKAKKQATRFSGAANHTKAVGLSEQSFSFLFFNSYPFHKEHVPSYLMQRKFLI